MFPKVLISSPTASAKNYCFDKFILNISKFTYPNFKVVLFDNTLDKGENVKYLNNRFYELFGHNNWFQAIKTNCDSSSVIERMSNSHNDLVDYAKENNYPLILHLETDVMPPYDVIERLFVQRKQVIGSVYYRDEGLWRKPMIQQRLEIAPRNIKTYNLEPNEDATFLDGTTKLVAHVGLGCVLMQTRIFINLKFRFIENIDMHPDSYFAEDCFRNNIPIYCDTSIICEHDNKNWLDVYRSMNKN